MKTKTFNIYFTLLLAIMAVSCQNDFSTDAIESFSSEDLNSKVNPNTNIWKYGGQSRITHKIIKDLRHSKEGRKFKKWVSTGAPIWSESKSLLINNEPTILVPIANGNRDGITAIAILITLIRL